MYFKKSKREDFSVFIIKKWYIFEVGICSLFGFDFFIMFVMVYNILIYLNLYSYVNWKYKEGKKEGREGKGRERGREGGMEGGGEWKMEGGRKDEKGGKKVGRERRGKKEVELREWVLFLEFWFIFL